MREIYEFLDSIGIKTFDDISKKIESQSMKEMVNLVQYIAGLIPIGSSNNNFSFFSFMSNSELGGDNTSCSSTNCRTKQATQLSRFSVLYADKIIVPSPFNKYVHKKIDKRTLIGDINLLLLYRPLIEKGILGFANSYQHFCPECLLQEVNLGEKAQERIDFAKQFIKLEYAKNVKVHYLYKNKPLLYYSSSDKYLPHGKLISTLSREGYNKIKKITGNKHYYEFTQEQVIDEKLINMVAGPVINDIITQNIWVNKENLTYLTNRSFDIDVLNSLHTKEDVEISSNMLDGLIHSLPIIQNVPLDKIIELRFKDGEAFKVYRDAMVSVVNNVKEKDIKYYRQACRDIISPELNKINLTIKNNRKNLLGSIAADILFASSIASVGLFSGMLPLNIGSIIAGVGGYKFGKDISSKIEKLTNGPENIKENKFYFLWKLQKSLS